MAGRRKDGLKRKWAAAVDLEYPSPDRSPIKSTDDEQQLIELLRNGLTSATTIIDRLLALAKPSLADHAEAELDVLVDCLRSRSPKDVANLMLSADCLQSELDFILELCPHLMEYQQRLLMNDQDHRVLKQAGTRAAKLRQRKLDVRTHIAVANLVYNKNSRARTVLQSCRSLQLDYLHASRAVIQPLRAEGIAYSDSFVRRLRKELAGTIPRTPYQPSSVLIWLNTDNLDIYARRSMTRVAGGVRVKSTLLHSLVTERIFFDPSCLSGSPPEDSLWAGADRSNFHTAVVPDQRSSQEWLTQLWCKNLTLVRADPLGAMNRPDAAADQQSSGKTITQALPILNGFSTNTSADLATYMRQAEAWYGSHCYFVHLGDFPTFRNIWFNIWRSKPLYNRHVPIGDEFHLQTHHNHAAKTLWYVHVIRPAALMLLRSDVRISYEAARYNSQESFIRMLTSAGLLYLAKLQLPEELLLNPVALMRRVESNVGLWEFLGFLFYYGVFALENKNAMRVGDNAELDKAWMWTSLLARASNKKNYAKYGVMMEVVFRETHPWVREMMTAERTFRESDSPCTGRGKGVVVERVSDHNIIFI